MSNKAFKPIKSKWKNPDNIVGFSHRDKDKIAELLIGRKVTKVDVDHLMLDNGVVVKAVGNKGGCNCPSGDYDLTELNGIDNIITKVEYEDEPGGDDYDKRQGHYSIFVFSENKKINLMRFDGSDGNGYYGTGYRLLVRLA